MVILFLFLFVPLAASENLNDLNIVPIETNYGTCFNLLPKEILNHIVYDFYLKEYGDCDAIPSMVICATSKSWYEHKYDDKHTVQEYAIKQKILADIAKLLYNTPFTTLAGMNDQNFHAILHNKKNKTKENKVGTFSVEETTDHLYGKLYNLLEILRLDQPTQPQLQIYSRCILYDRETEEYEYIVNSPDQLDTIITSETANGIKKKKIIKLIIQQIDFDQYYQKLYKDKIVPTYRIYTEKLTGEKFLVFLMNKLKFLIDTYNPCQGFPFEERGLINFINEILCYNIASKNYIITSHFLENLNEYRKKHNAIGR